MPGICLGPVETGDAYAIVIKMSVKLPATSVLSVRVSPDERAILEAAAQQSRTSLSDFVRRRARQEDLE